VSRGEKVQDEQDNIDQKNFCIMTDMLQEVSSVITL
jgi:hypothetical protein